MGRSSPAFLRFASTVVAAGIVTCCAVLGLSVSRPFEMLSRSEVVGGYVLPGAGLLVFLGGTVLSERNRINFAITTVSLMAGTYLVECFLASGAPTAIAMQLSQKSASMDTRSRLEVLHEMRAKGERVFPHLSGPQLSEVRIDVEGRLVMPLSPSPSNSKIVFCNESGQYIFYDSDEHGFNNPKGLWMSNNIDVTVIGDSFVHGACVDSSATIAGRLRTTWPATLNLGVSGAGPLFELAVLREYAVEMRPRVVVWCFFEGNDLVGLPEEGRVPELASYLEEGHQEHLATHQKSIDTGIETNTDRLVERQQQERVRWSFREIFHSVSRIAVLSHLRSVLGIQLPRKDRSIDPFPMLIRKAKQTVESWGGTIYFVYLPTYERYSEWVGDGPVERSEVLRAVEEAGIEIVDGHSLFASYSNPRRFWVYSGSHYTADAYGVIADSIKDRLVSRLSAVREH